MAVLDSPVHPSTIGSVRYDACREKVTKRGYYATDRRYHPAGSFDIVQVWVADRSSEECRYDLSLTDAKCEGCEQRGLGEAYWMKYHEALKGEGK